MSETEIAVQNEIPEQKVLGGGEGGCAAEDDLKKPRKWYHKRFCGGRLHWAVLAAIIGAAVLVSVQCASIVL